MKQQIKIWGTRAFSLALIVFAAQHWGMPLYKQYFTPKKVEVYIPTTKVREGEFTVSFHEMGNLEAENSVAVIAEMNGKIISIVDDGIIVSPGDKIAELDTTELEREIHTRTLEYENVKADVDRTQAEFDLLKKSNETELNQQKAQLDFDKNELKLAKEDLEKRIRLADEKLIPRSQVDQAAGTVRSKELQVEKGEAQFELKKKEIENKERQKEADIRNIKFRAEMARANLDQSESQLQKAMITAPAAGLVVITSNWFADGRRKLQEGDNVRPQQAICTVPDLSSMLVKVQVGESDAPKVSLEMPVLIRLEAVPGKSFHGTVRSISSLATEPRPWESGAGRKNFEVVIAVKEADPKTLKPGMTADVEFIQHSIKKAVYVPIETVIERNGKTHVFVKDGKRYNPTLVTTGKYNDNYICITKGLRKGQVVALRDPTRPLEEQEAGSAAPGAQKEKKGRTPIPEPTKK